MELKTIPVSGIPSVRRILEHAFLFGVTLLKITYIKEQINKIR
jgi:hypothetical protein